MPAKPQAPAGVLEAPGRPETIVRTAARPAAESALSAWCRPESWRWLEGRWALSGTLMGVPVAPPGDTLRLVVGSDAVSFESAGGGPSGPVLTFGGGVPPTVILDGLAGEGTPALTAVAATRRSVTFQDVITANHATPAVLKVTLRRVGRNIFHLVGDTAVGPSPVPMLAYTALKLNGRG